MFDGKNRLRTMSALLLFPLISLWMLPQTVLGVGLYGFRRWQGHRGRWYLFGPFLFWVVPANPPGAAGISLGPVVHTAHEELLKHEFCHLFSGLWLSWLYLPIYATEYLVFGHSRSPHERLTCHFENHTRWTVIPLTTDRDPSLS